MLRIATTSILQFLLQTKTFNISQLLLAKEAPATFETFHISNLLLTLPETKLQSSRILENTSNVQHYNISSITDTGINKTMTVFSEWSANQNLAQLDLV